MIAVKIRNHGTEIVVSISLSLSPVGFLPSRCICGV
jgi:hypothetical protein